jgi:hypothetical protein
MKDQIRGACRSSVFLVLLVLCGWSCQTAPSPRLPLRPTVSLVESGPCCEHEQIHDLYAAPYRLSPR